jgi:RimJ/RimL family protein N-acetyltransferase
MTEAVKIVEKEFFTNGLNRIQIKCDERNIASSGVAKKCGYVFEGKFREDSYSEYFKDFRNTLVFSKLKSDFKKEKLK